MAEPARMYKARAASHGGNLCEREGGGRRTRMIVPIGEAGGQKSSEIRRDAAAFLRSAISNRR